MKLADILSADLDGRAILRVAGYPAEIWLPCNLRDFHRMEWWEKWMAGAQTPAIVTRKGIGVSEEVMSLADARTRVQRMLHESCGHWWEMWKRMGPGDWPATYAWQSVLTFGRVGSAHLHAKQPQEVLANSVADRIMAEIDALLRVRQPVVYDTLPWLNRHFPALR